MSLTTHSGHAEDKMKDVSPLEARASMSTGIKPREKVHSLFMETFKVRLDSEKPDLYAGVPAHCRAVGLTVP